MARRLWPEDRVHEAIRGRIEARFAETIDEVAAAVAAHDVVVVGMAINPHPLRARRLLRRLGIPFHYLGYGSYLSGWRRRTALKMWTGWQTFPMIFVRGTFVGGADDLQRLADSGELKATLGR